MVADGLHEPTFDRITAELEEGRIEELKYELAEKGTLHRRYWVCAFCVNQHAAICGGFGPAPPEGTENHAAWLRKSADSVTKETFPLCTCNQPKFFSDCPVECEVNKFDCLMDYLMELLGPKVFSQTVACDCKFELFNRAWCVAELVEADTMSMQQFMRISSKGALDRHYKKLAQLDVQKCEASRIEDKEAILAKIDDFSAFNERLQWLIFGQGGLLCEWMDGESKVAGAGRVLQRVLRRASTRQSQTMQ
jgi:hypothetical protein